MPTHEILRVLRRSRLMLYAWRAARINMGLPDNHDELNAQITEIENTIEDLQS
jgi:hypothetical protein